MIMAMLGLPCDVCARPAHWFVDGVTVPCGCGEIEPGQLYQARERARVERERLMSMARARSRSLHSRVEWDEIYAALLRGGTP